MKQIPLTQGRFALVDDDDYDDLAQLRWTAGGKKGYYAVRNFYINGKRMAELMHRRILAVTSSLDVDHINHNTIDKRKENLRVCTRSENLKNKRQVVR